MLVRLRPARTLDSAIASERRLAAREENAWGILLQAVSSMVAIPLAIIKVLASIFAAALFVVVVLELYDWATGVRSAGKDAVSVLVLFFQCLVVVFVASRLVGWLATTADRHSGALPLRRQGRLAYQLLGHLRDVIGQNATCNYKRKHRSLHTWVDDGGFRSDPSAYPVCDGKSYCWLDLGFGDEELPWDIRAELALVEGDTTVSAFETVIVSGLRSAPKKRELTDLLGEEFELVECDDNTVVFRHGAEWAKLFSRGTSATPMDLGNLDTDAVVKVLRHLIQPPKTGIYR